MIKYRYSVKDSSDDKDRDKSGRSRQRHFGCFFNRVICYEGIL